MTRLPAKIVNSRLVGIIGVIVLTVLLGVGGFFVKSRPKAINTNVFGVAIKGYDAVAYFTDGRAVAGEATFEYTWRGARWRFSSAAHRELFAAQPERYVPQYGGF